MRRPHFLSLASLFIILTAYVGFPPPIAAMMANCTSGGPGATACTVSGGGETCTKTCSSSTTYPCCKNTGSGVSCSCVDGSK